MALGRLYNSFLLWRTHGCNDVILHIPLLSKLLFYQTDFVFNLFLYIQVIKYLTYRKEVFEIEWLYVECKHGGKQLYVF